MKRVCLVTLTTIMICGCSFNKEFDKEVDSKSIDTIYLSESRKVFNENFIFVERMENIDDKYLVLVDPQDDKIFKVFNLPKLDFKYMVGDEGRGPNEITSAASVSAFLMPNSSGFEIYNPDTWEVQSYDLAEDGLEQTHTFKLSYEFQMENLNGLKKINNSLYIAESGLITGQAPSYEFIALKPDYTKTQFTFGDYPKSNYTGFERKNKFQSLYTVNTENKSIAAFRVSMNELFIYDGKGKLKSRVIIKDDESANNSSSSEIMYRIGAISTNSFIYAIYFGAGEEQAAEIDENYKTIIEVWDWNGNMISKIQLNKPVTDFAVSEKYNKLYGMSYFYPDTLYEYELPNFSTK